MHLDGLEKANPTEFVPLIQGTYGEFALMCFHFAGGSSQSFFPWKQTFEGILDLYAIELPGRNRRYKEAFSSSILEAAESFADAYENLGIKKSVFYGHSLGAILAYETARILNKRGLEGPDRLIISSRSGPVSFPVSIGLPELSDEAIKKYLHVLQGTKSEVLKNPLLMEMILPIIKADLEIIYSYHHQKWPVLDIPVDVIGGIEDKHCPFETLIDWKKTTTHNFNLLMIPGGHFAPISHPDIILQIINPLMSEQKDKQL